MKITIENGIENETNALMMIYGTIINSISKCSNRIELKLAVECLFKPIEIQNNFEYGFGGSHFWLSDRVTDLRLILVEFSE